MDLAEPEFDVTNDLAGECGFKLWEDLRTQFALQGVVHGWLEHRNVKDAVFPGKRARMLADKIPHRCIPDGCQLLLSDAIFEARVLEKFRQQLRQAVFVARQIRRFVHASPLREGKPLVTIEFL